MKLALSALSLALSASAAFAATAYTIAVPGISHAMGTGVNSYGQMAGWMEVNDPQYGRGYRGFRYDLAEGTLADMNRIMADPSQSSYVYGGINDAGEAAATFTYGFGGHNRAGLWKGGALVTLPVPAPDAYATAIDEAGNIAGIADDGTSSQAFLWNKAGGTVSMLPISAPSLSVGGMNGSGDIAGYYATSRYGGHSETHPFLYAGGVLRQFAGMNAIFYDINGSGTAVGRMFLDGNDAYGHAFAFRDGAARLLGFAGDANAISDSGTIVGTRGGRGFVWNDGVALDLNDLIVGDRQGFVITGAYDISAAGHIAAVGVSGGTQQAILLVPAVPEPGPLLAIGCLAGLFRRRR